MSNTHYPPIKRAIISVADKTGVIELAQALQGLGVEILSTGGTAKLLRQHNVALTLVSDHTGSPEMLGGRVKTLHPKIFAGILAKRGVDEEELSAHEIPPIDLVVANLYQFEKVTQDKNCDWQTAIEHIDIGGVTLLRAAAKNHDAVTVLVDPNDYAQCISQFNAHGFIDEEKRRQLAHKAFAHTANYDALIANYFESHTKVTTDKNDFPAQWQMTLNKKADLRYGENPHQKAAFYVHSEKTNGSLASAKQLQGKELSYNNIADADAALACVKEFKDKPACVIVKHANPCGIAVRDNQIDAYLRAFATDPQSSFGGIIAFNTELDAGTADTIISNQFTEVIIAPSISDDAQSVLKQKKNVRVLCCGDWNAAKEKEKNTKSKHAEVYIKPVDGGLLIQDLDLGSLEKTELRCVTKRQATEKEIDDALFAWKIVKHVKSNAIVYAHDQASIGIGAGQMSRIDSALIAKQKAQTAELSLQGAVMASDAFFPFRDSIDTAVQAGITVIIQPGGSIRDQEVIDAADEANITMLLTGMRHFRH